MISFNDRKRDVIAKAKQWIAAGAVSAWLVDPRSRTIEVYRRSGPTTRYTAEHTLRDEPTLPGFTLDVNDIFESD